MSRKRMCTLLGWTAGGLAALLLNYVAFLLIGDHYPTEIATFASFVVGAFTGMRVADRLGEKGLKPLAITAGVLFAVTATLLALVLLSARPEPT